MIKNLMKWIESKKQIFYVGLLVFVLTVYYAPYFINKPIVGDFDGSIQNRLVWSVKGECFFVRPLNQTDVLLVRVGDCDKGNK